MPVHRSITRINNNENKDKAIHVCCGFILLFVFLSIILSNHKVDINTIILMLIFLFIFCMFLPFCIMFYKCYFNIETDTDTDTDSDDTPVVMARPIQQDSSSNIVTLDAVLCDE